jgi:hypothetical protein
MQYIRDIMVPVVHRHISNNITKGVDGQLSVKLKRCNFCLSFKPYSDYYLKPGFQNLHRYSIGEQHLRTYCVICFDEKNKIYNKGSNPKPTYTNTLEQFLICEEV